MPTISSNRDYSTSKNIKLYLFSPVKGSSSVRPTILPSVYANIDISNPSTFPFYDDDGTDAGNPVKYWYNKVPNLQEIPDLAGDADSDRDTIEITTLEDEYHEFADGLKNRNTDNNSISFTFLYDGPCYNALRAEIDRINEIVNANAPTIGGDIDGEPVVLRDLESYYQIIYIVLPDNSCFAFRVKGLSTSFNGAGTNAALTFTLNCEIDGKVAYHYPAAKDVSLLAYAGVLDGIAANKKAVGNKSDSGAAPAWGNVAIS